MARPLRIQFNNAVYHITSRGNARQNIYSDDNDRKKFLEIFALVVRRYNWICHSYCLTGNHYHLIIETPDANLSSGMRQLNGIYTQYFNSKHKLVGHLFQGRYKAIVVDKDRYLLSLCKYIVLNPVKAGIVESVDQWKWSSYGAIAGIKIKHEFLTIDWILSKFNKDNKTAFKEYRKFIKETDKENFNWTALKGQILLGTDEFVKKIESKFFKKKNEKEFPKQQRYATRPLLNNLLNKTANKSERDNKIYQAYTEYSYSMKAIADYLNLHYATVSRVIKNYEIINSLDS